MRAFIASRLESTTGMAVAVVTTVVPIRGSEDGGDDFKAVRSIFFIRKGLSRWKRL